MHEVNTLIRYADISTYKIVGRNILGLGPRHQGGGGGGGDNGVTVVLPAALLSWLATHKPKSFQLNQVDYIEGGGGVICRGVWLNNGIAQ